MKPKTFTVDTRSARAAMNFARRSAFGMIATENLSPARLKVLLGAMSVTVRSAIAGSSDAIGV